MTRSPPPPPAAPLRIPAAFYQSAPGNQPVLEWLKGLPQPDRQKIGQDLMRVQYGWPIGMPLVRSLGSGLHEVRSDLPSKTTARLILCFHEETLVVLHGFIKKTRTTPDGDLRIAKQRMAKVAK